MLAFKGVISFRIVHFRNLPIFKLHICSIRTWVDDTKFLQAVPPCDSPRTNGTVGLEFLNDLRM